MKPIHHRPLLVLTVVTSAAIALAGCLSPGLRAGDRVPYPHDYRSWHHVKSMVIQPGHPLHDSFGGIHHVYANEAALNGLSSGQYSDGAVFAFDLLATVEGGNAIQEGQRKVLGVMHKSSSVFTSTGGWGFAGFTSPDHDVVTDMQKQCFECHASQQPSGFVYSKLRG
jgi:hypothetical protein